MLVNGAIQRERGAHGHFDGALVQHGESSGQAEADGADVGVRGITEARGAAAEDFGAREKLDVDFEADDGLVSRQDFGAEGGKHTFSEGEAAEEKSGVDDVSCEGVPEERNGGDVAGKEAGSVMRIG